MPELDCEKVIRDAAALDKFLKFAQGEFSAENLEYWIAVEEYRKAWSVAAADTIKEDYLKEGSPKQVCIGEAKALQVINTEASVDVFDSSQKIALQTLKEDIFPRFCDSPQGAELAKNAALCS